MYYNSPLGTIHIESDGHAITALRPCAPRESTLPENEAERSAAAWLVGYFAGQPPHALPPLRFNGTAFQCRVWDLLTDIPAGCTATYGRLATQLGSSARAVGQAVGSNPIAIIVPCHRVVGACGKLGGYAYGTAMKQMLLNLEARFYATPGHQAEEVRK